MKIKTEADRIQLAKEIEVELGIDIEKYRSAEVTDTLFELLSFPQYISSYVVRPVLLALLAFALGFFLLHLSTLEYLIYAVFGFFLFLVTGILIGLLFLTYKIKGNIHEVMNQSVGIFNNIITDLKQSKENLDQDRKKYQYNLLFQGIIHFITIPIFTEAFADKIPLIGGLAKSIIYNVFSRLANIFDTDKPDDEVMAELNKQREATAIDDKVSTLKNFNSLIGSTLNSVFKIAQFPLKILLGLSALMLIVFIYLIH